MIDINSFASRHIGPRNEDINKMLEVVHCKNLDELIKKTVPDHILFKDKLKLRPGMSEEFNKVCLLYTSPSPRDGLLSRMPSSA